MRDSVVIVNIEHAPFHADDLVPIVGAAVVQPALKVAVETPLI
jgi:hypothetical protein